MSAFTMTLTLQGLPKSMNGSHGHWRAAAAERKRWRQLSAALAKAFICGKGHVPLERCKIVCTRHSPTAMDFDNRVASFKGTIDGLKDAGIIADDNDKVIIAREYLSAKAPRGKGFITITVIGVEEC